VILKEHDDVVPAVAVHPSEYDHVYIVILVANTFFVFVDYVIKCFTHY